MGLENRDYLRDEGYGNQRWRMQGHGPDVVQTLIIVNVIVYISQFFTISGADGYRYSPVEWLFELTPALVVRGQIWRLTTYDFLHARQDVFHILMNMYLFWLTGRKLQARYGWKEFLAFYLTAGILAGVGYVIWSFAFGHPNPCIGASGAVAAAMVLYAFHWPHEVWMIMGIIPIPVVWIAVLYAIFDLHPLLLEFAGQSAGGNVAHAAHVAGMIFAVLYYNQRWRILDWIPDGTSWNFRRWLRRRPKLRVHHPEQSPGLTPAQKQRMDDLLKKIQDHGQESLSAEEQRFMAEASRIIREQH